MGTCPPGHTLDRIKSDKDYEPENCRWVTQAQQMRNTKRTRFITHNGKTQCVTDWAIELGMTYSQLNHRLQRGWSLDKALTPLHVRGTLLEFNGMSLNINQWAARTGIDAATIANRLRKHGWSTEKALTTPARKKRCSRPQSTPSRS
jgi:hypothetical protein